MESIPLEFKELAKSAELYDQSEKVGNKFGLHIDQIGELDAEIRDVLMGSSKSNEFTTHIAARLEIDQETAKKITAEVNKEIFQALKDLIQNQKKISNISNFEKAGDLSIEHEEEEKEIKITSSDRSKILSSLENPVPSPETIVSKSVEEQHTEAIIDHMLNAPVAEPQQSQPSVAPEHHTAPPPANLPVVETVAQPTVKPNDQPVIKLDAQPAKPVKPSINILEKGSSDPYRETF